MAGLTTSTLRREYAPACSGKGSLYIPAYVALNACLKEARYEPERHHTGAMNCRKITNGTGYSLHAYGPGDAFTFWNGLRIGATSLAVDINWLDNPYGTRLVTDMPMSMIHAVEAIRTNSGAVVWRWGGRYINNKDAMHFEIVCSLSALKSGINWRTVPGYVAPSPKPRPWIMVVAGDTNASVYARGGPDNAVFEIQLRLMAMGYDIGSWGVDGDYGPATQRAISKFKADMIGLQKYTGQKPWPNTDTIVGINTINGLRWWTAQ